MVDIVVRSGKSKTDTMTVTHAGYTVVQSMLFFDCDSLVSKYERTYYCGDREVMHEIGNYMTEYELMHECENLTELLRILEVEAIRGN